MSVSLKTKKGDLYTFGVEKEKKEVVTTEFEYSKEDLVNRTKKQTEKIKNLKELILAEEKKLSEAEEMLKLIV